GCYGSRRPMPKPTCERQALERERDELPGQIAAHQTELATTPATNKARRERLEGQIRNLQKRLETIGARLMASNPEREKRPLTITLDTGALRLVDALLVLDGIEVDIATTTVTAREVEGTVWAGKIKGRQGSKEGMVLGESRFGGMVLADGARYEQLLALLSGGGFPKSGKRNNLSEGDSHILRDAIMLAAHAREGRDIFVSDDTKAIGHPGSVLRSRLLSEC